VRATAPDHRSPTRRGRRLAQTVLAALVVLTGLLPFAATASAVEGLTMDAHALFQGHTRNGTWMALKVSLSNDGPAITGELRISGGVSGKTRFGPPVDLPTGSRKDYTLYAQPPSFGGNLEVALISGTATITTSQVKFALHDASQLFVGIVAEESGPLAGELDLLPSPSGQAPVIAGLKVADLPDRVEAWASLDRLIWQDVDSSTMSTGQLAALRGWIASGGRLVIVGGTAGPDALTAFPDELLPYRPTALVDADPETFATMLGSLPKGATTVPALAGELARGRMLAASGDRAIAAEMTYGTGSVTIVGFDPATDWIADSKDASTPLWRRLLPARSGTTTALSDDGQLVSAIWNLPSLALPPIGGLIALLFGYILLIGPINYLVLRWLDRREWAWVTIPTLIAVFTIGAFGFGNALRGSDLIVHEIAIVRGAPGTTEGLAWSYLGLFSPTRATYQLKVPGGALLSSPISGDIFGGDTSGPLDVLQGDDVARVRDLSVAFGSLRAVRAEAPAQVPLIAADLRLDNGKVVGTITNQSDKVLEKPAVVLGSSAQVVGGDLQPGQSAQIDLKLEQNPFAVAQLSERIVGNAFFDGSGTFDAESQRKLVRRAIIDQLTFDPVTGFSNQFSADTALVLAWGEDPVVPVEIEGQKSRRVGNVLYEIPVPLTVKGKTVFRSDLMRSSVVEVDAPFFNKDPFTISFGNGTARVVYKPIPFEGTLKPSRVLLGMNFGGDIGLQGLEPEGIQPAPECVVPVASGGQSGTGQSGNAPNATPKPAQDGDACEAHSGQDGLPAVELRDRTTGEFVLFPHFEAGRVYSLGDPTRWVVASTGEVEVRFTNDGSDGMGFQFNVQLEGDVS
jgi:hypothetical protein